jgi:conjugal transfer/type IV secretion protein DotA/TraY
MAVFQSVGTPQPQQPQQQNTEPSRVRKAFRYSFMPEILPRIRALGFHFGHFAYLLALVFASARLIPQAHPVLNAANMGRYGIRQVIAIAANNLTWSKKNIDQIAIFSAIVMGLIMIVIQLGLIAMMVVFGGEARAEDPSSFFVNPDPATDPVLIFLGQVFGNLDGFWGAQYTVADGNVFGSPFHDAIHQMLSIYSMATMIIAVIIVLYYILTVIGEAAKTGTPFGQRFNSLWAPIRLVVALGLLVPLGSGLNSAQYITLWLAKQGSGLGTTVWQQLAGTLNSNADNYIIGDFKNDWVSEAALNVFFMEVCRHGENKYSGIGNITPQVAVDDGNTYKVIYQAGEGWTDGQWHTVCGEVSISFNEDDENSVVLGQRALPFTEMFNASKTIVDRLTGVSGGGVISSLAQQAVDSEISVGGAGGTADLDNILQQVVAEGEAAKEAAFNTLSEETIEEEISAAIDELISKSQESWIWAGVWYLELSRMIGAGTDAQNNVRPNFLIGEVRNDRARVEFQEDFGDGNYSAPIEYIQLTNVSVETRNAVNGMYRYYSRNKSDFVNFDDIPQECEGIGDSNENFFSGVACAVVALIVPDELTILASDSAASRQLDPMSTLVAAGYGILQKSWTYISVGLAANALSGLSGLLASVPFFGALAGVIGSVLGMIGSLAVLIGALGITAGFILYFLLPVLPFIYFFFAVVSWVMEIFEAIVAMPLWALAHLRIDGEGMPGQAAINGYFLLLSILLRPALIVIGLIAGALIFSGAVFLLQTLFENVLLIKGSGSSTGLEVLIFAMIFAYLCYSAGVTSFKLVDNIPNQILRWIGNGTPTFSDSKEDPVSGNQQLLAAAGGFVGSSLANSMSQGATGLGQGISKSKQERDSLNEGKDKEFLRQRDHDDNMEAQGRERVYGTLAGETRQNFEQRMSERASAGDAGGGGSAAARDAQRNNSDDPDRS